MVQLHFLNGFSCIWESPKTSLYILKDFLNDLLAAPSAVASSRAAGNNAVSFKF